MMRWTEFSWLMVPTVTFVNIIMNLKLVEKYSALTNHPHVGLSGLLPQVGMLFILIAGNRPVLLGQYNPLLLQQSSWRRRVLDGAM
jgi:hypothetical protein